MLSGKRGKLKAGRWPAAERAIQLLVGRRHLELDVQGPARMDPIVELFLQGRLRFREDSAFGRFLPGEIGKNSQLGFEVFRGDSIPKTIFECEHLDLLLFDAQNCRMRQADRDLLRSQVDGDITLEIETGLRDEGAVKLYPFRASGPGVEQFMFDLDLAGKDRKLSGRRGSLEVNAVVDRDPRLQLRHFHEGVPNVTPEAF